TKNIDRGLIERTELGNGRGKASVYRVCLENPYYPDQTPGGESLIEACCPDSIDSDQKACCPDSSVNSESLLSDDQKPAVKEPKACCQVDESLLSGQQHTRTPPQNHHLPTTTQSGGGAFLEKKNLATIGSFGKRIQELNAHVTEHGQDIVDKALDAIIAEGF